MSSEDYWRWLAVLVVVIACVATVAVVWVLMAQAVVEGVGWGEMIVEEFFD